jgi:hypothetical protein
VDPSGIQHWFVHAAALRPESRLSCLHPDRVGAALAKRFEEAFNLFTKLETLLLNEKESPTPSMVMPTTYDELMELKRKTSAARKHKRNGAMAHR